MSSHWEWAKQVIARHDATPPFAPENGQALRYSIGDRVIYTNDYGVEFHQTVTGFYSPEGPCSLYARGHRYLLDKQSWWMPVSELSLRPHEASPS